MGKYKSYLLNYNYNDNYESEACKIMRCYINKS